MPSDDELRRVAEDLRALARSLGRDMRAALDRGRDEVYGPRPGAPGGADGTGSTDGVDGTNGLEGTDGVEGRSRYGATSAPGRAGAGAGAAGRRTAREDLRAARNDIRRAQLALRQSLRSRRYGFGPGGNGEMDLGAGDADADGGVSERRRPSYGAGPGYPPRWDNWGRRHHCDPVGVGVRPGHGRSRRPRQPPIPELDSDLRAFALAPTPALPLRHRHDGSTLLGLLAVVFGMAWLVAGTHLAHVSTEAVVAVALMVLGAATVVTARTDWALSRRAWPMLGGAVLALALLALSASPNLPVGFRHLDFGSRTFAPATWANLPAAVHSGFGKTVIDLSALPAPPPEARTLSVDSAAGRLEINVPTGLLVVVDAQVAGGMIDIDGVARSGLGQIYNEVLHPSAPGPALTLRVRAGFGSVDITSAALSPTAPFPPTPPAPPGGTG